MPRACDAGEGRSGRRSVSWPEGLIVSPWWLTTGSGSSCARVSAAPALTGELDLGTYETAMAELAGLFEASGDVTLDLSNLTFVDSSGSGSSSSCTSRSVSGAGWSCRARRRTWPPSCRSPGSRGSASGWRQAQVEHPGRQPRVRRRTHRAPGGPPVRLRGGQPAHVHEFRRGPQARGHRGLRQLDPAQPNERDPGLDDAGRFVSGDHGRGRRDLPADPAGARGRRARPPRAPAHGRDGRRLSLRRGTQERQGTVVRLVKCKR